LDVRGRLLRRLAEFNITGFSDSDVPSTAANHTDCLELCCITAFRGLRTVVACRIAT
jgi:hypothetical protein